MDGESLRARLSEPAALRHCHFLFCTIQTGHEVVVRVFSSHALHGATGTSVIFVVARVDGPSVGKIIYFVMVGAGLDFEIDRLFSSSNFYG